jgi:hypothetical protein
VVVPGDVVVVGVVVVVVVVVGVVVVVVVVVGVVVVVDGGVVVVDGGSVVVVGSGGSVVGPQSSAVIGHLTAEELASSDRRAALEARPSPKTTTPTTTNLMRGVPRPDGSLPFIAREDTGPRPNIPPYARHSAPPDVCDQIRNVIRE